MRTALFILLLTLAFSEFAPHAMGAGNTAASAATQPAATANSLENTVIRRNSSSATTQPGAGTAAVRPNTGLDVKRVSYSLAIVICLILALRWGGRLLFPGAKAFRPSRAVQVLSRNIISPKQQVIVLQVGRRVVVVGDSGAQMNPLCEI
nr:flagellar biosynthetic protein FliO [Chthoniobacterales bacterium]